VFRTTDWTDNDFFNRLGLSRKSAYRIVHRKRRLKAARLAP
jgi:hypothetical protein